MSFVAVLSTLLLVGIQRQQGVRHARRRGDDPAELRRMVLSEAGIVAVLGVRRHRRSRRSCSTGRLVLITPVIIGYKDPFVVDRRRRWSGTADRGRGRPAGAALYPSRRAGRVEVLEALRYE